MMNDVNQGNNSTPEFQVKRKRGRPRKDESLYRLAGSEKVNKIQTSRVQPNAGMDSALVGHIVSGVLDGSFDAGYLLSVRVGGTGALLRGIVFDPSLSVPITATNDVAPQVRMIKRSKVTSLVGASQKLTPLAEAERPPPKSYRGKFVVALASEPSQELGKLELTTLTKGHTIDQARINQDLDVAKCEVICSTLNDVAQTFHDGKGIESMERLPSDEKSVDTNDKSENKTCQLFEHVGESKHHKIVVDKNTVAEASDRADQVKGQTNDGTCVRVGGVESKNACSINVSKYVEENSSVGHGDQEEVSKHNASQNVALITGDLRADSAADSRLTSMSPLTSCPKPDTVTEPMREQPEQTLTLLLGGRD